MSGAVGDGYGPHRMRQAVAVCNFSHVRVPQLLPAVAQYASTELLMVSKVK